MSSAAPCLFSICEAEFDHGSAKAEKEGKIKYAHRFSRDYMPEFNPDAKRVISDLTTRVWSPSVFTNGIRKEANFKCSSVLGLDFDDTMTIGEAMEIFKGYRYVIGTTRSHSESAHRFRVLLKLDRVITSAAYYKNIVSYYIKRFHSDPSCKDCARFYYPCTEIIRIGSGENLSTKVGTRKNKAGVNETYAMQRAKNRSHKAKPPRLPLHIANFLANGLIFSKGRNVATFVTALELKKLGHSLDEIIVLIGSSPFDRTGFSDRELIRTCKSAFTR